MKKIKSRKLVTGITVLSILQILVYAYARYIEYTVSRSGSDHILLINASFYDLLFIALGIPDLLLVLFYIWKILKQHERPSYLVITLVLIIVLGILFYKPFTSWTAI